jgi:hypothetical protein
MPKSFSMMLRSTGAMASELNVTALGSGIDSPLSARYRNSRPTEDPYPDRYSGRQSLRASTSSAESSNTENFLPSGISFQTAGAMTRKWSRTRVGFLSSVSEAERYLLEPMRRSRTTRSRSLNAQPATIPSGSW